MGQSNSGGSLSIPMAAVTEGGENCWLARRSERKRGRKLHDTVALLGRHRPEERGIDQPGRAVEAEIEVAPVERPQRMIQKVIAVQAKLQLLPLPVDIEILEQPHVRVE